MHKLRLGMIGAGKMAFWHLKSYEKIPQVEITAIANPSSERGKELALKYKARHFRDGLKLIEEADVDLVDICVPTGLHKDFILKAIDKGLHIYTEKPIGASLEEIGEIILANKKKKQIIFNGFNYRFLPEFCKIRAIINSGQLGSIRYIRFMRTTKENPGSYIFGINSCGIFNEFHCHFVDLLFSFGFGRPQKIFASGTTVHNWKINPDTATLTLFYPDKMVAEITASLASPGLAPEAFIIGTEGSLRLDYASVSVVKKRESWTLPSLAWLMLKESFTFPFKVFKNPFDDSCRYFIDCVINGKQSQVDELGALETFKITDAATRSYQEKQPIPF